MTTTTDEQLAEWQRLAQREHNAGILVQIDTDTLNALIDEVSRLRAAAGERDALREAVNTVIGFLRQSADECNQTHIKREAEFHKWLKNKRGRQPAPAVALPVAAAMMQKAAGELDAALAAVPAPQPQAGDRLLAVAERAALIMRLECVKAAENYLYLTGIKARRLAGAIDLLDPAAVARRAVEEQEKQHG